MLTPCRVKPALGALGLGVVSGKRTPDFSSTRNRLSFSGVSFAEVCGSSAAHIIGRGKVSCMRPVTCARRRTDGLGVTCVAFECASATNSRRTSDSGGESSTRIPAFGMFTPFLGSSVCVSDNGDSCFCECCRNCLQGKGSRGAFVVRGCDDSCRLPRMRIVCRRWGCRRGVCAWGPSRAVLCLDVVFQFACGYAAGYGR